FRTSSSSLTGSLHSLSCRHCRAGYAFHGAKITQPFRGGGRGGCLVCFVCLVYLVGGPKTVCLVYLVHLVCLVRDRRRSVLLTGSEIPPEEPDRQEKPNRRERQDLRGSSQVLNPMRRCFEEGGSMSWRMTSKRERICPSCPPTFRSSCANFVANALWL